jgi:glycerol kinase
MTYLISLDQGTSSSRTIIFDKNGQIVGIDQSEFKQIFPKSGWVEHDPEEIWSTQLNTLINCLNKTQIDPKKVVCVGITNQRETTVVWNKTTGEPVYNAIVWQDRRAEPLCADLRICGYEELIKKKTGLRIDSYFSATKLAWILDNVPGVRSLANKGELAFGTIDSWLIWKLTGGHQHVTDVSNAARTMLFNVHQNDWDDELLDLFRIPENMMPAVYPSSADFGRIHRDVLGHEWTIAGVAGDQQSALFGQACFRAGQAKNTYGTGCFMLMHTGSQFQVSQNGLITTSAAQVDKDPQYALEGSVFIAGAIVQWLRDGLKVIKSSNEVECLAGSVTSSEGVIFVPAFTGLGAPYWMADVKGCIVGLTRGTTLAHIARAALESIALQSTVLLQAMSADSTEHGGLALHELRVDGGACVNDLLMQIQADLLGVQVIRPLNVETTALGVAYLAGLQVGVYQCLEELESQWRLDRIFEPSWTRDQAEERIFAWEKVVQSLDSI